MSKFERWDLSGLNLEVGQRNKTASTGDACVLFRSLKCVKNWAFLLQN